MLLFRSIIPLILLFSCKDQAEEETVEASWPWIESAQNEAAPSSDAPTPSYPSNEAPISAAQEPVADALTVEAPTGNIAPQGPADHMSQPSELASDKIGAFALGRILFYDETLSADQQISCGSCHQQQYAFGDNSPTSTGVNGQQSTVNTPPLINLAWSRLFFWDGREDNLEDAIRAHISDPTIFDTTPEQLVQRAENHRDLFEETFPQDAITADNTITAIAHFVRELISFGAPIDLLHDPTIDKIGLTQEQERGILILEERLSTSGGEHYCNNCHVQNSGVNLDNSTQSGLFTIGTILNNGTGNWRVPTIRNISVTGPYLHDGSIPNLAALIAHYNDLPDTVHDGLKDAEGNPIQPQLSEQEIADLVAVLDLFTDETFLTNPRFGKP